MDREIDEYKSVIQNLNRLHEVIVEKNKLSTSANSKDQVTAALGTAVKHLTSYVGLYTHIVEVTSAASAGVAKAAQLGTQVMTTPALAAAEMAAANTAVSAVLKGTSKATSIAIAEAVGKAAGEAAANTAVSAVLKGTSNATSIAVAETAGKAAGEAVAKTVTVGAAKESVKAMTLVAARPVAETAAKTVMKKKSVQISAAATKIAAKSAGKSTGAAVAKVITKSLPFLNFGLVALDTYETYKAGKDLAYGSSEENMLRNKIEELKDEANKIVIEIYNYLAEPIQGLPHIVPPFP